VNEARSFEFPSVVRHCGLDDWPYRLLAFSRRGVFYRLLTVSLGAALC